MNFTISKANQNTDFSAIKNVYYQTWTYSYVGIIPQALLDNLDKNNTWHPETRLHNTLIACNDDKEIVGVCTYGPARRHKYDGYGEVYSLYVLPKFQHLGIGKELLQRALDILQEQYSSIYLIVLRDNLHSRAFYEWFNFVATDDYIADQTSFGILHEIVYLKN